MSISLRQYRAAIYHYVDIGTQGISDPRYVKQVNENASDGNWWFGLDGNDGNEVVRGGAPEYRRTAVFSFADRGAPLNVSPKGMAIMWVERQEIYEVNAIVPRPHGAMAYQVRVELAQNPIGTATYSDGYYYPD